MRLIPMSPREEPLERGSVLMLVPAGFLILLLLGAIAVDNGATYLAQRQLQAVVEAAANDSAGAALSNSAFYSHGQVKIDPAEASRVVCKDLAAQRDERLSDVTVAIAVVGSDVFVEAHAEVSAVFGTSVPGLSERSVRAVAGAVSALGPGETASTLPPSAVFTPVLC